MRLIAIPLAVLAAAPPAVWATQAPGAANPPGVVGVTSAEVAVDFVVRDRKGRIVRDLGPGEVEVYEDGVRQEVSFFRLIAALPREAPAAPAPSAPVGRLTAPERERTPVPSPAPDTEREAVVALVFDRISPAARSSAVDAALAWLALPAVEGRQVGVFRIGQGIEELQGFTDDRATVMAALEHVQRSASTPFSSREDRARIRAVRLELGGFEGQNGLAIGGGEPGTGTVEASSGGSTLSQEARRRTLMMRLALLEAADALDRDQQGLDTTNALLALVNGLRTLPGRKAVVFFSEGLSLPERVLQTLGSVVSEANRGGVSFYAADPAGLRATSAADETRRELQASADVLDRMQTGRRPVTSEAPLTRMVEKSDDMLRLDPASGLGMLANETGGFLIRDTNDISSGLRRVEEDLGAYYLLSYAPKNETWDGRYRRIDVRIRRSGVSLQARRGYYAVRTPTPTPVLEHEAPALAWLELAPSARELPVRVRTLQFPAEDGDSTVAIVAELPGAAPSLNADRGSDALVQDFTLLALVRDANGRIVHKASRHYALSWPKAKADEVRRGRILFEREALLSPGRYTVEVVAYDALRGASGVDRAPLELSAPAPQTLRVSSLMVVGHTEPHALGNPGPLLYQGVQLYPSFGEPFRATGGKPLPFLVTLRPGLRVPRQVTVEIVRGDLTVRDASVPLPAADASGEVRVVSGLPIDGLEPGPYGLRLVVSDGLSFVSRTTAVTVAP